eukprot:TRINITY_DN9024_c0_g1_i1.p1 TRINITY_DN9024_c0_g1~~TRINITY_DN9024_c0_g1_i1.p1  ORF type:complete len:915 (-),score=264.56 TRINITY_DN9024_c0_g1_i1:43-2766(-)
MAEDIAAMMQEAWRAFMQEGTIGLELQALLLLCVAVGFAATSWLFQGKAGDHTPSSKKSSKECTPRAKDEPIVSSKQEKDFSVPAEPKPSAGVKPAPAPARSASKAELVFEMEGGIFDGDAMVNIAESPYSFEESITGAFSISFRARWDALRLRSRIVDLGDGQSADNIVIANLERGRTLLVEIYRGSAKKRLLMPTALTIGETNDYLFTVSDSGFMRLLRDGSQLGVQPQGYTPRDVKRTKLLVGGSNWPNDENFKGEISQLKIWRGEATWQDAFPQGAERPKELRKIGLSEEKLPEAEPVEQEPKAAEDLHLEQQVSERDAKILAKKAARKARKAAEAAEAAEVQEAADAAAGAEAAKVHEAADAAAAAEAAKAQEAADAAAAAEAAKAQEAADAAAAAEAAKAREAADAAAAAEAAEASAVKKRDGKTSWADIPEEASEELPRRLAACAEAAAPASIEAKDEDFLVVFAGGKKQRAKNQHNSEVLGGMGGRASGGGSSGSRSKPQEAEAPAPKAEAPAPKAEAPAPKAATAAPPQPAPPQPKPPPSPQLASSLSPTEKEIMKLEKKSREVLKLKERQKAGEELEKLQLDKLERAGDIGPKLAELQRQAAIEKGIISSYDQEVPAVVSALPTRTPLKLPSQTEPRWRPNGACPGGCDMPSFGSGGCGVQGGNCGGEEGPYQLVPQDMSQMHPMAVMGMPMMGDMAPPSEERWEVCWEWANRGYCPRGQTCRWEHPEPICDDGYGNSFAFWHGEDVEQSRHEFLVAMVPAGPGDFQNGNYGPQAFHGDGNQFGPCGACAGQCGPCGPCNGSAGPLGAGHCGPCGPCGGAGPCGPCGHCGGEGPSGAFVPFSGDGPSGPCRPFGGDGPSGPCRPFGGEGPSGPCGSFGGMVMHHDRAASFDDSPFAS